MHSVSDEDWKIEPRLTRCRFSAAAFVRLPLCASAQPPGSNSTRMGWTSRIAVMPFAPAVE